MQLKTNYLSKYVLKSQTLLFYIECTVVLQIIVLQLYLIFQCLNFFSVDEMQFWNLNTTNNKPCCPQDLSYMVCIEVTGPEAVLLEGLSHLCSPACGLTFAARSLLGGQREGSLVLYAPDQYPMDAVGTVTFTWRPPDTQASNLR